MTVQLHHIKYCNAVEVVESFAQKIQQVKKITFVDYKKFISYLFGGSCNVATFHTSITMIIIMRYFSYLTICNLY